jgi:predicted kinase
MSLAKTVTVVSLGIVLVATVVVIFDRIADRNADESDALHDAIEDRLLSLESSAELATSNGVLAG